MGSKEQRDRERSDETDASAVKRYEFAVYFIEPTDCVLDVSCGEGYGSAILSKVAKQVEGIDYSREAIEIAKRKYHHISNTTFFEDDAQTLRTQRDGSKDMIVSFETIEHLKRPEAFIKKCYDILKPGGLILLSTPNESWSTHTYKYHISELKPAQLINLLKAQSFTIEKCYGEAPATTMHEVRQRHRKIIELLPLRVREIIGDLILPKTKSEITATDEKGLGNFTGMIILARRPK